MEKKLFESPRVEILLLSREDMITTSQQPEGPWDPAD